MRPAHTPDDEAGVRRDITAAVAAQLRARLKAGSEKWAMRCGHETFETMISAAGWQEFCRAVDDGKAIHPWIRTFAAVAEINVRALDDIQLFLVTKDLHIAFQNARSAASPGALVRQSGAETFVHIEMDTAPTLATEFSAAIQRLDAGVAAVEVWGALSLRAQEVLFTMGRGRSAWGPFDRENDIWSSLDLPQKNGHDRGDCRPLFTNDSEGVNRAGLRDRLRVLKAAKLFRRPRDHWRDIAAEHVVDAYQTLTGSTSGLVTNTAATSDRVRGRGFEFARALGEIYGVQIVTPRAADRLSAAVKRKNGSRPARGRPRRT